MTRKKGYDDDCQEEMNEGDVDSDARRMKQDRPPYDFDHSEYAA